MKLLVAGGAGYIGSHLVLLALEQGHEVTVLDHFGTGHREAIPDGVGLIEVDLLDESGLQAALKGRIFDAVLHFAAWSLVGESVDRPDKYLHNNVVGSLNLMRVMHELGVGRFVFSSTAAVYGEPEVVPISEHSTLAPINPYGQSKVMVEQMLKAFADRGWIDSVSLRYFNAAGADPLGRTGEAHDPETHLIPNVLRSAAGDGPRLKVFGDDYPTRDGTCVRDYIHVSDLAEAHLLALDWLVDHPGSHAFNLGTGDGLTVMEILETAGQVVGRPVEFDVAPRRDGDPPVLVASSERARQELGWVPTKSDAGTIIETAGRWHGQSVPGGTD